jgi:hypothetical protein
MLVPKISIFVVCLQRGRVYGARWPAIGQKRRCRDLYNILCGAFFSSIIVKYLTKAVLGEREGGRSDYRLGECSWQLSFMI